MRDRGGRARRIPRGWAVAAACLGLCACAVPGPPPVAGPGPDPFAVRDATDAPRAGPPAPGTMPGPGRDDAVPFGRDEERMRAAGREVFTGRADGAAYLYTADRRIGLMAGQPGYDARTLSYSGRDWYITCQGGGGRCTVRVATAAVAGRPVRDAVRFLVAPGGTETLMCLGPEGTTGGTVRLVQARRDFHAGAGGCLVPGDAERVLSALGAGDDFQYRYTDAEGDDVRGWHPSFGLTRALALARWLGRGS